MSRTDAPDPSSIGPASDSCSRCGRPVARVPLLFVGKDLADSGASKVLCLSCLDRKGRGKAIRGLFGGFFGLLDFGVFYVRVAWLIIVLILAALIRTFGHR